MEDCAALLPRSEIDDHSLLPEVVVYIQTISMKPREYRENQDFNFEFAVKFYRHPVGK